MGKYLEKEINRLQEMGPPRLSGRVTHVIGLLIESLGPDVFASEICVIYGKKGSKIFCQVVGFKDQKVLLMPLGDVSHIAPGSEVYPTGEVHRVAVSEALCGRVLDALGKPIDGKGELFSEQYYPVSAPPPQPLSRLPIVSPFVTKIKSLDGLCSLGKGQRIGIFSSPGVGKSTLLGMIAKRGVADVFVIALIGERGREVREFIERELGPIGLSRSVVIVATADQSALLRAKGANVATAIAEYFRDLGKNVVLMMDSVSRYAMALREIGLAVGESAAARGYPPSVFADLPKLLERAGNSEKGSITGIYTILCEEDEFHDPVADQVRSLLDGHIHLSKELAAANHFPPVNVLKSLSRVMNQIVSEKHRKSAGKIRSLLHAYKQAEELIHLGVYVSGSDPKIDEAISKKEKLNAFLTQESNEHFTFDEAVEILEKIVN